MAGGVAGVTGPTWANYEPGPQGQRFRRTNRLVPDTVARLARAVGVSVAELRGAGAHDAAEAYLRRYGDTNGSESAPRELREIGDAWERLDTAGQQQLLAQLRMTRDWVQERLRLQSAMPRQYDLLTDTG